jgi:hypothetical protein
MNLSGALEWASEWTNGALRNRHAICAVQMKESQSILGAVVHIGVASNTCHCKEIDLGSHDRARYR